VLGVVVVLIVVAVIVLAVRGGRTVTLEPSSNQPPSAGRPWPAGSWELTHQIELPSGWSAGRQEIRANGSTTEIGGSWAALVPDADPGDFVSCGVTVLRPGQSIPRPAKTEPVTVGDAPAEYAPAGRGGQPYGVFWRGPVGAWANVRCYPGDDRDSRTEALALAERVRFTSTPVFVPVRLAALPRGYQADHLNYREAEPGQLILRAEDVDAAMPYLAVWYPRPPADPDASERGVLNGRPVTMYAFARQLCFADGPGVCVSDWSTDSMGNSHDWPPGARQVLVDVAAGLVSPTNLADRATWFTGREAFPA
jgi:hypothetical protein